METAQLAFGSAVKSPAVREGGPLPPGSPGRFAALRALLSTPVETGANTGLTEMIFYQIPEPSSLTVTLLAACAVALRRRR